MLKESALLMKSVIAPLQLSPLAIVLEYNIFEIIYYDLLLIKSFIIIYYKKKNV